MLIFVKNAIKSDFFVGKILSGRFFYLLLHRQNYAKLVKLPNFCIKNLYFYERFYQKRESNGI